jgi:microcystin-dependent protein
LEDRPTVPANIVTYTADQNSNVVLSKNPSLKVSGGDNTDFGQSVEDFVANNKAIKTAIVEAILAEITSTNTQNGTALQKAVIGAALPIGTIVMWRKGTDMPCGWQVVTGMTGRFPVGAGQEKGSELSNYPLGDTGGEEFHSLSIDEMPEHDHVTAEKGIILTIDNNRFSGNGGANFGDASTVDTKLRTGNTGGKNNGTIGSVEPHENRPPYYAVLFIEKISNCVGVDNVYNN